MVDSLKTRWRSSSTVERGWRTLAVQSLVLLVAVNGALAFYAFSKVSTLKQEVAESLWRNEQRFHSLQSQVQFDSERRRLLLGIRDAILRTRPKLGFATAYELAQLVLEASEKYPRVDPLLLVAVGIVESAYNVDAVSHAGARGLYQIYPSTGRLLARMLGWEFTEEMLHDPAKNTEMAACYLNLLGTAYNDLEMILAEYNGGPVNAGYFRARAGKLAEETRNYVPKVVAVYERLGREIETELPQAYEGQPQLTRASDGHPSKLTTVASTEPSAGAASQIRNPGAAEE